MSYLSYDITHMLHALRLSARGLGLVAPNPSVGAVIVKNGRIVGTGVTARGGRPHAETQALAEAGRDAAGATLYVTLEPCAHHGNTGPCAEAIVKAGITRVVGACTDPNPQVAGKGFAMLREAGIDVTEGLCEAEARRMNEGFFSVIERGRPFITVKIATSLDGRTVTLAGEDRWITGEPARTRGHLLRASHDAILTGIGTVLEDDPALTCRLPGRETDSPQRVVLDSQLRMPKDAKILPAWLFTSAKANKKAIDMFTQSSSKISIVPEAEQGLALLPMVEALAREGITRLLVEGGKTLTEAFLQEELADRIYWFRSPQVVGEKASLVATPAIAASFVEQVGQDCLEIYDCRKI